MLLQEVRTWPHRLPAGFTHPEWDAGLCVAFTFTSSSLAFLAQAGTQPLRARRYPPRALQASPPSPRTTRLLHASRFLTGGDYWRGRNRSPSVFLTPHCPSSLLNSLFVLQSAAVLQRSTSFNATMILPSETVERLYATGAGTSTAGISGQTPVCSARLPAASQQLAELIIIIGKNANCTVTIIYYHWKLS